MSIPRGVGGSVAMDVPFAGTNSSLLDAGGGKVVVLGLGTLERRDADGTLDTSFGTGGHVLLPGQVTIDAKLTAAGEIVVAGQITRPAIPNQSFLARYHANGSIDTSFADDGILRLNDVVDETEIGAVVEECAVQPDGGIVLRMSLSASVEVIRLTRGGTVDNTFNVFRYSLTSHDASEHLLKLLDDGRILVGGTRGVMQDLLALDHGHRQFTLTRLFTDGQVDTGFGDNGFFSEIGMNDLAVLDDGSLLTVAGEGNGTITLARLTADGDLFPGFGTQPAQDAAPRVLHQLGTTAINPRILLDNSGRALIVGDAGILRVDPDDGAFDASFGRVTGHQGFMRHTFSGALVRADGEILLAKTHDRFTSGDNQLHVLQSEPGGPDGPISLTAGTVSVTGSSDNDYIVADRQNPFTGGEDSLLRVRASNSLGRVYELADVTALSIDALEGDDIVAWNSLDLPGVVFGGLGNDRIAAGFGNDTIFGNAGDDRIDGDAGDDRLDGNAGRDVLRGQQGNDRVFGGAGNDVLTGDEGDDQLFGSIGNDRLTGGAGADRVMGSDGNDLFISLDHTVDDLYGGGGTDTARGHDDEDLMTDIETT